MRLYMERTLSVEERIRRAEEIYNRRYGNNYYDTYLNKSKNKKSHGLGRRLLKQIIVCSLIYCVFYVVSNREYYLSKEFLDKVQEVSSKNVVLNNTYNYVMGYVKKYIKLPEEEVEQQEEVQQQEETQQQEDNTSIESVSKTSDENIGGANEEEVSKNGQTQEEQDVEYLKNKINFILPVEGAISSTFGWRSPTTSTVPKYHTGLDIAASTGTAIKSATDGKIILASSQGDYGKHYKIQIDDVIIVYGHCSKLYLKEGDTVKQGQEIAEVGSTGNSTGPHLHFEIRREERLIDPQLILNI